MPCNIIRVGKLAWLVRQDYVGMCSSLDESFLQRSFPTKGAEAYSWENLSLGFYHHCDQIKLRSGQIGCKSKNSKEPTSLLTAYYVHTTDVRMAGKMVS